ncbi:hypothetical protein RM780_19490 [Streptomyces sp. DSM 44917]|uniref:Septum formation-related domain-containing protein n=1 Tax=Streptomyces boetiae TaxID=3075541 RepID=A0ABU2LD75_9ACTN|nr:hypothetical protein [Streptomyces sp. DSM 44917]MDT0309128.1 hypothetical protein [Streptomyces sp. DSM 44917]
MSGYNSPYSPYSPYPGGPAGPPPPPPAKKQNQGWIWAVLALLVVGGVVAAVALSGSDDDEGGSQGGGPFGGGGAPSQAIPTAPTLDLPSTPAVPTAPTATTPTPDPVADAFDAVQAGDCLRNYYDGVQWDPSEVPQEVSCEGAGAFYFVTSAGPTASCSGSNSEAYWYAPVTVNRTLCLARQYHEEQCFAGDHTSGEGADAVINARINSVWPCDTDSLPADTNQLLRITGYYTAQEEYPPGFCAENSSDQTIYYYWEVDDGESVICALVTD